MASFGAQLLMEVTMARKSKRGALVLTPEQTTTLKELAGSRTAPAREVERAKVLLGRTLTRPKHGLRHTMSRSSGNASLVTSSRLRSSNSDGWNGPFSWASAAICGARRLLTPSDRKR